MRALSTFGSALQTRLPDRTWPTLRGHPPLLELSDEFNAPAGYERTPRTTEIVIEVEPTWSQVYPIASLTYFLDACVRPLPQGAGGPRIRLQPSDGADSEIRLPSDESLCTAVSDRLKRYFTLETIVRTDGLYEYETYERGAFIERIDQQRHPAQKGVDERIVRCADAGSFEEIYRLPLSERVSVYESIPAELVDPFIPDWPYEAHIEPHGKHLELLPYIAESFSSISCSERPPSEGISPSVQQSVNDFVDDPVDTVRSDAATMHSSPRPPVPHRSRSNEVEARLCSTPENECMQQMWLGDHVPLQSAKPTKDAFRRRLATKPRKETTFAVVVNDRTFSNEAEIWEEYGFDGTGDISISTFTSLSQHELSAVFSTDYDLVHYIGHIEDHGFRCVDGYLDMRTATSVECRSFVLNACRSFEQAHALVAAGAIAGLCTASNVTDTMARIIGRDTARLLNCGFTLGYILQILVDHHVAARQYLIAGDPRLRPTMLATDAPALFRIQRRSEDEFELSMRFYGLPRDLGSCGIPPGKSKLPHCISPGETISRSISRDELARVLDGTRSKPVSIVRDSPRLRWTDELDVDAI